MIGKRNRPRRNFGRGWTLTAEAMANSRFRAIGMCFGTPCSNDCSLKNFLNNARTIASMFLAGIRPSSVHNSAVPCSRYVPENSFKERKIVAVFNSLLVHPQATAASIEAELNSLNTLQGIHFDGWDNGGHDSIVCASSLHFQAGSIDPANPQIINPRNFPATRRSRESSTLTTSLRRHFAQGGIQSSHRRSTFVCWVSSAGGALSTGRMTTTGGTTSIEPVAKAVAAGYEHTCALLNAGTVQCWGDIARASSATARRRPAWCP